jgi:hypothetical protein
MKDASEAVERIYRAMLLKRSRAERLKMGFSMLAMARSLVRSAALEARPSLTAAALRKLLFLRFYGQDFGPAARRRILRALEKT